jgi:hypothetical protein
MPRGRLIGDLDSNIERLTQMRMEMDALHLVIFNAADTLNTHGKKAY